MDARSLRCRILVSEPGNARTELYRAGRAGSRADRLRSARSAQGGGLLGRRQHDKRRGVMLLSAADRRPGLTAAAARYIADPGNPLLITLDGAESASKPAPRRPQHHRNTKIAVRLIYGEVSGLAAGSSRSGQRIHCIGAHLWRRCPGGG